MKPLAARRLFSEQTIAKRLSVLRRRLFFIFALIGLSYVGAVVTTNRFTEENKQVSDFQHTTLELSRQTLEARRREKDFLLRSDPAYINQHKAIMDIVEQLGRQALEFAPNEEEKKRLERVQEDLKEYGRVHFPNLAAQTVKLGLDENSGLHGKLRTAVHNVESIIDETQSDALKVSMLMMRRHEKDYIQRHDAEKYLGLMAKENARFSRLLAGASLAASQQEAVASEMATYQKTFRDYVDGVQAADAELQEMRDHVHATEPLLAKMVDEAEALLQQSNAFLSDVLTLINVAFGVIVLLGSFVVVSGFTRVSRAIMQPMNRLTGVIRKLAEGDDSARAGLESKDEFGDMGRAFDGMMEERVATQNAIRRENEQLNDSVLKLLEAVAQLARRDLTIKVPVTEDVTGPVADALNLLTSETGKVLRQVSDISADVTEAALKVKEQADNVRRVAADNRSEVEHTAESLAGAATTMNEIAELAQVCNTSADNAIKTTQQALKAVADTVGGINSTRDTIRETEKRIKRLGERSQEISGVVDLINTIAERTHILALNASMHAASAGEAGRGFAVVADEVQRLAENARDATGQIASLVNNIQVETLDTVNTMNTAIEQVVEGSKLADHASNQMHQTEQRTSELVSLVQKIATSSTEQAGVSNELLLRAAEIRRATDETSHQIEDAGQQTEHLVEYAKNLLGAVRVFKLPSL